MNKSSTSIFLLFFLILSLTIGYTQKASRFSFNTTESLSPVAVYPFASEKSGPSSKSTKLQSALPLIASTYLIDIRKGIFTVNFNYTPHQEMVEQLLYLSIQNDTGSDFEEIAYTLIWQNDRKLVIQTTVPTKANTTYQIHFDGHSEFQEIGESTVLYTQTFTTPDHIVSVSPSNPYWKNMPIKVVFLEQMDHASVEAAFSLTPPMTGRFDWQENSMTFIPAMGRLDLFTTYTATLQATARTASFNYILDDAYEWSFRSGDLKLPITFGAGADIKVIDAHNSRRLGFKGTDISSSNDTDYTFYAVSTKDYILEHSSHQPNQTYYNNHAFLDSSSLEQVGKWPGNLLSIRVGMGSVELDIPARIRNGIYLLEISRHGFVYDQIFIVLSDHVIIAKEWENQLAVWVTGVNGTGTPGATVQLIDNKGQMIASKRANEDGVVIFPWAPDDDEGPILITAYADDDVTLVGLDSTWDRRSGVFNNHGGQSRPSLSTSAIVYSDQPLYYPGQTVNYRAILRDDDNATLSTPPVGSPVEVQIRNSQRSLIQSQQLKTNAFGTINSQLYLPEDSASGVYKIEIFYRNNIKSYFFRVNNAPNPAYNISINLKKPIIFGDAALDVIIEAHDRQGIPLKEQSIVVNMFRAGTDNKWYDGRHNSNVSNYKEDHFPHNPPSTMQTDTCGQALPWLGYNRGVIVQTDENGQATLMLPQTIYSGGSLLIEATYDDCSGYLAGDVVRATLYQSNHKVEYKVEIETDSIYFPTAQPFNTHIQVQTLTDTAVRYKPFTLFINRANENEGGYTTVQTLTLKTDVHGEAIPQIIVDESGIYDLFVSIEDGLGRNVAFFHKLLIGENFSDSLRHFDYHRLNVTMDKASYAPGEVAQILISSHQSGPAWLTVERNDLRHQEVINLTAPLTIVPYEVSAEDAPNVFVSVNMYETSSNEGANSHLYTTGAIIKVPPNDKRLTVEIMPDGKQYRPGQNMDVLVRITDHNGNPVSAEFSLGIVDNSLFTLHKDHTLTLFDTFHTPRNYDTPLFYTMATRRSSRDEDIPIIYGSGTGPYIPKNDTLGNFSRNTIWYPALATDANGELHLTIPLPNNSTNWRLTAKAVTIDTKVGESVIFITTSDSYP